MKATTDVTTPTSYIDPSVNGATLVYDGLTTSGLYWNAVTLQTPFTLPQGSNLYIFFEGQSGVVGPGTIYWAGHLQSNRCTYSYTGTWTASTMVPLMRFGTGSIIVDSNSVSMEKIITSDTALAGQGRQEPVVVKIKNKGYILQ